MLLHVLHETAYDYAPAVRTAQHMAHLKPASTDGQQLLSHRLKVDPAPARQTEAVDVYGASWLLAECASVLARHDPARERASVHAFAQRVEALGFERMRQRYRRLLASPGVG